ncbi:MarR family transcriptional regulator [Tianweitania sp.]|uniref:MarR family transcriptional regulator n=1 Tax=Tianweitania sp. TaxID=2021634 RepID=UPI00289C5611|nr:MarR family transcriptional regulator [Tianweitania sp.]
MAAKKTISAPALAERLELAGRSLHSIGYAEGLYPAQWTALRYFAKSPDGARTASSLARFQGLANGPVSRTVRTLIQKELVRKAAHQPAGRAEHLEVAEKGYLLLERDPIRSLVEVIERMSDRERGALASALEAVIGIASDVWAKESGERR